MTMQAPIILDIEASGFGVGSFPVEIGYAGLRGESWWSLVRPQPEWRHWDVAAEALHHQSREDLMHFGQSVQSIAQHLNRALAHQIVYTDAWFNDYVWLSCLYEAANMQPNFKLEDLRLILSSAQSAQWHHTKQSVMESLAMARHRASTDAKVLQLTWLKTAEMTQAFAA